METTRKPNYVEELLEIFRSPLSAEELRDQISDYHESDIADAFILVRGCPSEKKSVMS